uniref:Uncharacterized protein n=1 Tax=Timema shepardi TaxID=629360 RepID=A0A7R9G4C1_TIMSH|nr:unnamed protein product [Timema shepardi]
MIRTHVSAIWTPHKSNTDNPLQVPTCQQSGLLISQTQLVLSRYPRVSNLDSSYVPTCQQSGLLISQTQIILFRYPRVHNQDDAQNTPLLYTPELAYDYWLAFLSASHDCEASEPPFTHGIPQWEDTTPFAYTFHIPRVRLSSLAGHN